MWSIVVGNGGVWGYFDAGECIRNIPLQKKHRKDVSNSVLMRLKGIN
jgi:hypothetical protein